MKFCPVCASPLEGKLECSCGFKTTSFTESDFSSFNSERKLFEKKESATLEELINKKVTDDEIQDLTYLGGGGMLGGCSSTKLSFKDKTLTTTNKQFYYAPTIVEKYSISDEKLNEIKEFIEKYNFPAWSEIKINESLRPTDIGVTTLLLCYPSYSYSISSIANFNKEEENIFFNLKELVYECINDDNLIEKNEINNGPNILGLGMITIPDNNKNTNTNTNSVNQKYCPECGYKLNNELKFCPECGNKMIKKEN